MTLKRDVICAAGFEVGGQGHEPRNIRNAALEAGQSKETYSTLAFLEGAQPRGHPDFSPAKMISDF